MSASEDPLLRIVVGGDPPHADGACVQPADLAPQSASLVHDGERRRRVFHARGAELTGHRT